MAELLLEIKKNTPTRSYYIKIMWTKLIQIILKNILMYVIRAVYLGFFFVGVGWGWCCVK